MVFTSPSGVCAQADHQPLSGSLGTSRSPAWAVMTGERLTFKLSRSRPGHAGCRGWPTGHRSCQAASAVSRGQCPDGGSAARVLLPVPADAESLHNDEPAPAFGTGADIGGVNGAEFFRIRRQHAGRAATLDLPYRCSSVRGARTLACLIRYDERLRRSAVGRSLLVEPHGAQRDPSMLTSDSV
jgi:hypothetical protein